jgi:hypothetical protein
MDRIQEKKSMNKNKRWLALFGGGGERKGGGEGGPPGH